MSRRSKRLATALLLSILCLGAGLIAAQGAASPPPVTSPDAQLLAEVQALRTDLREAVRTSLAAQVVVVRLQFQEQRLKFVSSELTLARQALAAGREARVNLARDLEAAEKYERENPGTMAGSTGKRKLLAAAQEEEGRVASREAELAARVAAEERRWNELNGRLDQMERTWGR